MQPRKRRSPGSTGAPSWCCSTPAYPALVVGPLMERLDAALTDIGARIVHVKVLDQTASRIRQGQPVRERRGAGNRRPSRRRPFPLARSARQRARHRRSRGRSRASWTRRSRPAGARERSAARGVPASRAEARTPRLSYPPRQQGYGSRRRAVSSPACDRARTRAAALRAAVAAGLRQERDRARPWHGPCCFRFGREDAGVAYGHERDLIPQRPGVWPLIGVVLSVTALGLALRAWLRRAAAAEVDGPQRSTDADADVPGSGRRSE